ncbi:hypothetical protein V8E54_003251 [Elaphomyces granulatus]
MGMTGVGKSTFINYFSDEPVPIGHTLEACTGKVDIYPSTLPDGTKLFLVDTPGFDDTYRSDTDILGELANWLNDSYAEEIRLTGIIYLHRISDTRLRQAARKNLKMFKALCGEDGLPSVVLATTRWTNVSLVDGIMRETELKENSNMWKKMIERGSRVWRQDEDDKSAWEIIRYLISIKRPVTLEIQEEMSKGATLDETAAGQEVHAELEKQRQIYEKSLEELREEMARAIAKKDLERQEEIAQFKAEIEHKQAQMLENERKLQVDREELRRQKEEASWREREGLQEQLRQKNILIAIAESQLEQLKADNTRALDMQRMELQLQQSRADIARLERRPPCVIL